jgi:Flp pilus assembly protein TadD
MALQQWEQALATLDSALRIVDDDADLHADRGRAARQLSRLEVAREAFGAALALSPSHPAALEGRLELDLLAFRPAEGRQILERIDAAELRSLSIERLRGRLLTMEIAGQSGIGPMRRAVDAHDGDRELLISLGWLYMQAEQHSNAARTFGRLIEGESPPVEAVLGHVLAQVASGPARSARTEMNALMERIDEATLDASLRAELHAVLARLAHAEGNRAVAQREAQRAIDLDPKNSEAHLVLADLLADREQDATAELEAALAGRHPPSRPLALLATRDENNITEVSCDYARRYRRAAPGGQHARAIQRVMRECRRARN